VGSKVAKVCLDILSNDQRIIVASDRELGLIVTWNRSATLQLWDSNLDECGIRTLAYSPTDMSDAKLASIDWLNDIRCEVSNPNY
jgi:hypothetical protein